MFFGRCSSRRARVLSRVVVIAALAAVIPVDGPRAPAALAAPSSEAKAAGFASYQVVTGEAVTVGPGKGAQSTAKCPAGTLVLGGGELNTVLLPTGAEVSSSNPDIYDNDWDTSFTNTSDLLPVTLRTRAICVSGLAHYEFAFPEPYFIPRGRTRKSISYSCPNGLLTLAGGTDGTQGLRLLDSFPGGSNEWQSTVYNISLLSDLHSRPFNVCGSGVTRTLKAGDGVKVPKGGRAHASVDCPAGSKVMSGGGESFPNGSNMITDTYPSTDGKTWTVYVKNIIDEDSSMRVRAFCGS